MVVPVKVLVLSIHNCAVVYLILCYCYCTLLLYARTCTAVLLWYSTGSYAAVYRYVDRRAFLAGRRLTLDSRSSRTVPYVCSLPAVRVHPRHPYRAVPMYVRTYRTRQWRSPFAEQQARRAGDPTGAGTHKHAGSRDGRSLNATKRRWFLPMQRNTDPPIDRLNTTEFTYSAVLQACAEKWNARVAENIHGQDVGCTSILLCKEYKKVYDARIGSKEREIHVVLRQKTAAVHSWAESSVSLSDLE